MHGNIFHVTGHLCREFTGPRWIPRTKAVTRSFDVFFVMHLNKRLSKQSWGWWFERLSRPLLRHCNGYGNTFCLSQRGKLNFWSTHPKTDVPYMFYTNSTHPGQFSRPAQNALALASVSFLHCCHKPKTGEQTVKLSVIWDATILMWHNSNIILTHWGRVTHICVSNLTIIDSDNGLSPGRRQAIIWTNAGI